MRVCEYFAGVGGFRVGLERYNRAEFETVFFNQWEPAYKSQFAYECYVHNFGLDSVPVNVRKYTNFDVRQIPKGELPDFDLLVGGFPCQNYSVAGPKSSKGIEGEKGVLWWDIRSTLEAKKPRFVLLENVDRLLKSPASQRGRDFGIILRCFYELNYNVEWRIINAAEYGKPQKRRRIFIFAYKNDTTYANTNNRQNFFDVMFPCEYTGPVRESDALLDNDLTHISDNFTFQFEKAGSFINGHITSQNIITPTLDNNTRTLGSLLVPAQDNSYNIIDEAPWIEAKGAKKKERTTKDGYTYIFSEGSCPYPDKLDIPARTMLTSEGTRNRSSHVVEDPQTNQKRILLPLEAERIQTFPDNWTAHGTQILENGQTIETTLTNRQRYFLMGNALVTELITDMAPEILRIFNNEQ